jgi:flagellin
MGYSTTSRGIAAASYHADISSVQSAYNAIEALDHDLAQISEERAKYGAAINNMFHAVDSMQIGAITATASRSRILDTDYASVSADLARNQIIQQAGMAMIAQANALPEVVLTLLRT